MKNALLIIASLLPGSATGQGESRRDCRQGGLKARRKTRRQLLDTSGSEWIGMHEKANRKNGIVSDPNGIFNLDTKGLDMVFFAAPDMPPQAVTQEQVVVASTPAASLAIARQKTFGICELFYATEDDRSAADDSSVNSLHPTTYMNSFLPKEMQSILSSRGSAGMDWGWYAEWSDSFKVKILREPAHGKFVNLRNDPKLDGLQYLPDRDYVGKDRVDVLVEGKDDRGRPIALTIKYFINVLPKKDLYKIADKGTGSIIQSYKKLCGVGKGVWDISENTKIRSADPLAALLTGAGQNLAFTEIYLACCFRRYCQPGIGHFQSFV